MLLLAPGWGALCGLRLVLPQSLMPEGSGSVFTSTRSPETPAPSGEILLSGASALTCFRNPAPPPTSGSPEPPRARWDLQSAAARLSGSPPEPSDSEPVGWKGSYASRSAGSSLTRARQPGRLGSAPPLFLAASSSSELPHAMAEAWASGRACQALPLELIRKQIVDEEEGGGGLAGEPDDDEEEKELAKAEGGPGLCRGVCPS